MRHTASPVYKRQSIDGRHQLVAARVQVTCCGGQAFVVHQHLDHSEILTLLEKQRRKRVPQGMWACCVGLDPGFTEIGFDQIPQGALGRCDDHGRK